MHNYAYWKNEQHYSEKILVLTEGYKKKQSIVEKKEQKKREQFIKENPMSLQTENNIKDGNF